MPKADLEKAGYTKNLQKAYRKAGNEEWITFLDWTTERTGDTITFHIIDKKIKDWNRETGVQAASYDKVIL